MSVVKNTIADYQKAMAAWRSAADEHNTAAEAFNASLVHGSDGKPVGYKDGYYSKNFNGSWDEAMMTPSTKDPRVMMLRQNPTVTNDSRVYYAPVGESGMYSNDGGTTLYRARAVDDSGAVVLEGENGQSIQAGGSGNGGYMTGSVSYKFPDQPGEFTQTPPNDPKLTLAQQASLSAPDPDQALASQAMASDKGTTAQRYAGFDKGDEGGLVARAIKGFKKE